VSYLSATAEAGGYDLRAAVLGLTAKGGPAPWRQAAHMLPLALGRYKVRPEEYFTYALWRKDRGRAFVRDFISNKRMRPFNNSLNMPARGVAHDLVNDKLGTEALLHARGLPVSRTVAAYVPPTLALPDLPYMRPLRSTAELEAFLSDPANLPIFGKPRADSFARGAAAISGPAEAGAVRFLTGETVPISGLAAEIARDWQQGYLFQPFYQCAPSLQAHVGAAMASLRIVTLWTDAGIEPWYAVIRLPAKTAMHDGDAKGERIWGLIDLPTGKIAKLRSLRDPHAGDLAHGNDPDQPFLGFPLPDWDRAVEICRAAHESFPGHGIIGWDVFLTAKGAILNEANASPGHVYQAAAQRPLLNPDMRPAYERALGFARKHGGGAEAF
jgi:Sugar-transfer associated ATP-grasp